MIFVVQLGLRAGRWSSDSQISDSEQTESPVETTEPARQEQVLADSVETASTDPGFDVSQHILTGVVAKGQNAGPAVPLSEARDVPVAYTVQVGAFSTRSAAERVADRLKTRGYLVRVEPPPPGELYLVWVGSFQSAAEAGSFAQRIVGWLGSVWLDGSRVRTTRR